MLMAMRRFGPIGNFAVRQRALVGGSSAASAGMSATPDSSNALGQSPAKPGAGACLRRELSTFAARLRDCRKRCECKAGSSWS
ncbi:hypothetical protein WDZ92_34265 [Nostoc sp. NIES-2111]